MIIKEKYFNSSTLSSIAIITEICPTEAKKNMNERTMVN